MGGSRGQQSTQASRETRYRGSGRGQQSIQANRETRYQGSGRGQQSTQASRETRYRGNAMGQQSTQASRETRYWGNAMGQQSTQASREVRYRGSAIGQVKRYGSKARKRRGKGARGVLLCAAGVALCMWMAGGIKAVLGTLPDGLDIARAQGSGGEAAYGMLQPGGLPEILDELLEKNEETLDFVQSYPDREEYKNQPIDLAGDFASGEVPLLMQWDKRWGYDAYGSEMIGVAGCGPLCLEMAYLYFTGDTDMTPRKMADFAFENGYYTEQGTSWSLWTEGAARLGLEGEELALDERVMKNALDAGRVIVCSMGPGDFTTKGHFILIRGYSEDGFLVNDPNRRSTSRRTWSYEELQYQIKNLWSLGKG